MRIRQYTPRFIRWISMTGLLLSASCASQTGLTPSGDAIPLWARQPTRTVDNGYIVYVESDDNPSQERAKFHSEAAALADMMNECTLIPKGVRVEDRFGHQVGHVYEAYAKVGVEMAACEEAKRAVTPEDVRRLANATMTEEVKKFQDQIGQTDELLASVEENGSGEDTPTSKELENPTPPTTVASNGQPQPYYVRDDEHFFVIREQVAVAKQQVVLAPPTAYQPQSPEYTHFAQTVPAQSQTVAQYEASHPAVKTSPHPWSFYRHTIMRPHINTGAPVKPRGVKPAAPAQPNNGRRKRRRPNP